ncbi:hypothetical protein NliqN6_0271 [Naganishia liquefaciens]|uniref:Uncharacterized protein n=1 Tax=Naganishia liquefaciens TaxID=104408 RepID=A0A8H3TPB7_9TREE|nr:hypothetical protein NliqN6_0271 [Naganishia liquefaciens]
MEHSNILCLGKPKANGLLAGVAKSTISPQTSQTYCAVLVEDPMQVYYLESAFWKVDQREKRPVHKATDIFLGARRHFRPSQDISLERTQLYELGKDACEEPMSSTPTFA